MLDLVEIYLYNYVKGYKKIIEVDCNGACVVYLGCWHLCDSKSNSS